MADSLADLDDIVEIRDSEINVAEIMARLRENLARRPRPAIDVSQIRYQPGEAADICADEKLVHNLRRARELRDKVFVGDQLRPPATAVGRFVQPLKRQLHQLVRFYVDLASARQVVVNTHLVDALDALVAKGKADEERLAALEEQVKRLQEQLAQAGDSAPAVAEPAPNR